MNNKIMKAKILNTKSSNGKISRVSIIIIAISLILLVVSLILLALVIERVTKEDEKKIEYVQNIVVDHDENINEGNKLLYNEQEIYPWNVQEDGETIKNENTGDTKKIGDTITNDEVLIATGGTQSTYKETWTVIGVENGRLKLVSTKDVSSFVKLGKDDPELYIKDENGNPTATLKSEIVEIYNREGEDNLDLEKAIWSYQHAVETLDKHAREKTGITSARSITIEDLEAKEILNITEDKKKELSLNYGRIYNYFYNTIEANISSKSKTKENDTWSNITASTCDSEIFLDEESKIVVVDSENDEVTIDDTYYDWYIFTDEQKTKFASSIANEYSYWLASPYVGCYTYGAFFRVHCVMNDRIFLTNLFNSLGNAGSDSYGVRAVVYI